MPTLDRLQARLGGPDFEVVALSIDEGGMPVVQAFLRRAGIRHLRLYDGAHGSQADRAMRQQMTGRRIEAMPSMMQMMPDRMGPPAPRA